MTINELELTLRELQKQHPALDEGLLVTLLRASGWDEKNIKEMVAVWKMGTQPALPHEDYTLLQPPEEPLIEPSSHEVALPEVRALTKEKESLVPMTETAEAVSSSLPDNLPLRPFETSPHVWSFAKYKDVFFGGEQEVVSQASQTQISAPKEKQEEIKIAELPAVVSQAPLPVPEVKKEPLIEVAIEPAPQDIKITEQPSRSQIKKAPLTGKDEGILTLLVLLSLTLILLVIYMYSNGRL